MTGVASHLVWKIKNSVLSLKITGVMLFVNGRIACHLKAYFTASGFKDITLYPSTLVLDDFEVADTIYDIEKTVNNALLDALLTPLEAKSIINDYKQQTTNGGFQCALTSYTIIGIKAKQQEVPSEVDPI